MTRQRLSFSERCEVFSTRATVWAGGTAAQMAALSTFFLWLLTGSVFGLEKSWHLVFEPLTAFVPFVMVFLIQRSQNKDSLAVQLKLNELVAAVQGASNRLIDVEGLSEEDLDVLRAHYRGLAAMAEKETEIGRSHSIEEAQERHSLKQKARGSRT